MYKDKKVVVAMPAYNAAKTLQKTYGEVMDQGIVDLVVIVDYIGIQNEAGAFPAPSENS